MKCLFHVYFDFTSLTELVSVYQLLFEGASTPPPIPHVPITTKPGVEKSQFHISANQLEVDENVSRTHFRIHWLIVK